MPRIFEAEAVKNKVIIWNEGEELFSNNGYGKIEKNRIELSLIEAAFLLKREIIRIFKRKKEMSFEEFYKYARKFDKRFSERFRVYEELRERGLLVRTGFKFGCDFRVYERGVKLKKGPKSQKEHTKWVVFCVPEDFTCAFQELSRAVRLAHNIRAKMLWAVVDNENDVTYYEITRISP